MTKTAVSSGKNQIKLAGLIGGMSWESTALYYRWINEGVRQRLGGLHSAPLLLHSVNFAEIEALQHSGNWRGAGEQLSGVAKSLEQAGAQFLVICTNTMHKVADQVTAEVSVPLLHIVDPTAAAIKSAGIRTVGLLGTGFTLSDGFYKNRMEQTHGIEVLLPDAAERAQVHRVIYEQLCLGIVNDASRVTFLQVIDTLRARGATGIILGCTEITMLVKQVDTEVQLFDTTAEHAAAVVKYALD